MFYIIACLFTYEFAVRVYPVENPLFLFTGAARNELLQLKPSLVNGLYLSPEEGKEANIILNVISAYLPLTALN